MAKHIKKVSRQLKNIAATGLEKLFEKRYTSDILRTTAISGGVLTFIGKQYSEPKWIIYGIVGIAVPYGIYELNSWLNRRD